jgi:succinate-semialdehyde dehydrogenase / glutarate-semialdehyde dehydrogenase
MELLRDKMYIGEKWRAGASGKTIPVWNPATGELIKEISDAETSDIEEAVDRAHRAFGAWSSKTAAQRCSLLRKWHRRIMANRDRLAEIMTMEQGKPLAEAKGEISYAASFVRWFSEEGVRAYGETIPAPSAKARFVTIRQPIGVAALITPWNFPAAMIARKVAPALAAGCTTVIKPSEETPFSALALAALAEEAGIPSGVINVVTVKDPQKFSDVIFSDQRVRKISFTGSIPVGKKLMEMAAPQLKKLSLELGGNAPFVVFDDADIDSALRGLMTAKFRNGGQACIAANRVYLHEDIYETFSTRLIAAVGKLKIGKGLNPETDIGPLINRKAVGKIQRLMEDAVGKGARLVAGGKVVNERWFEPTVLTDCNEDMEIFREEIFGPLVALYKFKNEDEVVQSANNTPAGLAGYFYSGDVNRCWRVGERLQCGMVGVNSGFISDASAPFGGVKESGIGREGSRYGLEEYMEIKYLSFGVEG